MRAAFYLSFGAFVASAALNLGARGPAAPVPRRPAAVAAAAGQGRGRGSEPLFDEAAVQRGEQLLVEECGFCHGSNARGGSGGPDLLRSPLVLNDEQGKELGEFLAVGRPDKGMPKFTMSSQQVSDLATFLHARVAAAIDRANYRILDIVTGDAAAGEAYFNGAGGCRECHSAAGDLKGIATKYDPVALQGRIIMPRGGRGGGGRGAAAQSDTGAIRVTVTPPSGQPITGVMLRLTDFDVTLRDASGDVHSWLRNGDVPKVVVTDPLKAHVDRLSKWTDADMHNVTAYLVTLK